MSAIGLPLPRPDGSAKVTGAARYVADTPIDGLTHATLVMSTISHGRISGIDTAAALAAPGVLAVVTHENAPRVEALPSTAGPFYPLQDDRVLYEGQAVAVVVAETFQEPDTTVGDVDEALAAEAEVVVDEVYRTADRHHNPMENLVTIAQWHDGSLLIHSATQWVWGDRAAVAAALSMPLEQVRVVNEFVGGGFGAKTDAFPYLLLAPMAARVVGRPVLVALTKAHTYTSCGRQAATEQRVTLGSRRDGTLVALRHTSVNPTSIDAGWVEYCSVCSRSMYACPAIETRNRVVHVNLPRGEAMRAPHEGPGMAALEIAMDELAVALDLDPLELRIRNHADIDPTRGVPFSSKRLLDCYTRGAERFGWAARNPEPRSMRDGRDLIGWGMASATMPSPRVGSTARVTIDQRGEVLVETGTQEIGTGVHTILPQIAADALGVDPACARLVLGDTTLPMAFGNYGSSTTIGVGSAVLDAATKLRAELDELAADAEPEPGRYGELLSAHGLQGLAADGAWAPGGSLLGEQADVSIHTFGAVFAEVRIDQDFCIPRLTRMVGVYSAGRIINARTARSQMTGGMIWGLGQALLEVSEVDLNLGRFLSKNLAGYLVPVNADIPELDASFIEDEIDQRASLLGAKGIGELAAVGAGPAIANAVYHATGIRVRELPIRPEMLLAATT